MTSTQQRKQMNRFRVFKKCTLQPKGDLPCLLLQEQFFFFFFLLGPTSLTLPTSKQQYKDGSMN